MNKCFVIGGGFAGLSASVHLSNAGYKVELIEASPKLGGRAYSFLHKATNTIIDNGQHIMMGCYNETLKFLELIGASDKIEIQAKLSVNFLKPGFELHQLKVSSLLYPFNLLSAIFNFSAISLLERLSVLRFFLKLPIFSQRDLSIISVDDLLTKEGQNENVKRAFWEIICVGALNTNLKKASAKVFVDIIKEIFLKGSFGSKIILPRKSLSEMYCEPAKQFIEKMGGKIFLSEKVEEIKVEKDKVIEVRTDHSSITDFDFVICTVPHYALERIVRSSSRSGHSELVSESEHEYKDKIKILKQSASGGQHDYSHSTIQSFNPQYSSILNVHVWIKENQLGKNFYALIGSKLHWLFSHDSLLTCVISDADYLMHLSDEEIMNMIYSELEKYMNVAKNDVKDYFIIKEKRATFIPSNEILNNRPNTKTEIKNLFLAGDWVNTYLPSTIESAVKSGREAAEAVGTVKGLNLIRLE
jgi:hydroxysqualene dehydroxylase